MAPATTSLPTISARQGYAIDLRFVVPLLLASSLVQAAGLAGIFTEQQAAQGKLGYDRHCAQCHHLALRGTGHGPELAGPNLVAKWGNQTIAALNAFSAAQMPAGAPCMAIR